MDTHSLGEAWSSLALIEAASFMAVWVAGASFQAVSW